MERREISELAQLIPKEGRRSDTGRDGTRASRPDAVLDEAGGDDAEIEVVDRGTVDPARRELVTLDACAEPVRGARDRVAIGRVPEDRRAEVIPGDLRIFVGEAAAPALPPPGDRPARVRERAGEEPIEEACGGRRSRVCEHVQRQRGGRRRQLRGRWGEHGRRGDRWPGDTKSL